MVNQAIIANEELQKFGYEQKLNRTLKTSQLTSFGLTYLQPMGPAVVFGYLLTASGGSVTLPYLFAFFGMIFTVLSYSVLIKEYPLAGSIYNYVKIIGGDFWGFIAGWLLALDYILIPTITSICAATYAHQLIPSVSYEIWLLSFILGMGWLNLIGIKSTSFFNIAMLTVQIIIVVLSFLVWTHFLINHQGLSSLFSAKPFHFSSLTTVIQASSIAIFSFLGFDAVTTLAEESINPRKDIPRAMMLCTCIGFLIMFLTGYLGMLLIPDWKNMISDSSWVNATLFNLAKLTGGDSFAFIYTVGFILAMIVTNLVGTAAASRLLYGMGRDNKIPQKIFGVVNQRWKTPHGNIIFIVILEIILGSLANQDQVAELINFGAIAGFVILNLSVVYFGSKSINQKIKAEPYFFILRKTNILYCMNYFVFPCAGLVIMIAILVNMKFITLLFGLLWLASGVLYLVQKNKCSGLLAIK